MGWNWDHAQTIESRSYNAHAELGEHLRNIAPRADWQALQALFARDSDGFDIQPAQAARIAEALKALAPHAGPTWNRACLDLGASAAAAARSNAVWHWT
ncbi:hypothetical protein [Kitasatospora sp. NPDC057223]|uniref:DUF7739 domain-containing protein n=1 Tax=Kitasatospora sp. NPDC057223 TaxID=3346055 RepID=UPI003639432C